MFSSIASWFKRIFGVPLVKADLLAQARVLVREAALKHITNAEKREWVVKALTARGVSESTARIAVELAYQALQKELDKLIPPAVA